MTAVEELRAELRNGLEGVTPGPWITRTLENFGWNVVHYRDGDKHDVMRVAKSGVEADAAHIARCSPENIAALLDALVAALSERDAHSKEIERLRDCLRERPNTLLIAYEYGDHERLSRVAAKALDRADASDARVTALEKVLEPFAAIGRLLEGASGDHAIRETVYTAAFEAAQCLTVGDFRDAASLSPKLGDERAPSKGGAT